VELRIFQVKWLTELFVAYEEPSISLLDPVLSINVKYLKQESGIVRYSVDFRSKIFSGFVKMIIELGTDYTLNTGLKIVIIFIYSMQRDVRNYC
jgi:hypothetical protein